MTTDVIICLVFYKHGHQAVGCGVAMFTDKSQAGQFEKDYTEKVYTFPEKPIFFVLQTVALA